MTTVFLSPKPNFPQFIPGGAVPANGAQLFCYAAGSSTKQNMYTTSAGNVAWANPIVLDSGGNLGGSNEIWIPQGLPAKFVLAPANDSDPPVSPYFTWDNVSGVGDSSLSLSEWVSGPTPTFVSATSFTLAGDQTSIFTVGRRVKTTNTGGTIYSTIVTSAFTALTTVTVQNDSGVIDSGLSAVSYGLLDATHNSIPLIQSSAIGSFTVTSTPASTVTISGLPFRPDHVQFNMSVSGQTKASFGFDNISTANCTYWDHTENANQFAADAVFSVRGQGTAGNYTAAHVSSFTADGFILTSSTVGAPTGVLTVQYMAKRSV